MRNKGSLSVWYFFRFLYISCEQDSITSAYTMSRNLLKLHMMLENTFIFACKLSIKTNEKCSDQKHVWQAKKCSDVYFPFFINLWYYNLPVDNITSSHIQHFEKRPIKKTVNSIYFRKGKLLETETKRTHYITKTRKQKTYEIIRTCTTLMFWRDLTLQKHNSTPICRWFFYPFF